MVIIIFVFALSMVLTACGNDDTKNGSVESTLKDNEQQEDANNDTDSDTSDEVAEKEEEDSSGVFEMKVDDQLDLGIGDTGTFDTTLGTYEMTVDSAKLVDTEIDGVLPKFDFFIVLDLTIKNTSDQALSLDDLTVSTEATEDLDMSGYSDISGGFDSIEMITGTIEPGESVSGQFFTEAYSSEEYYFRKDPGNVTGGSSNQVIWTIKADEAK